jgi:hypothetical protein
MPTVSGHPSLVADREALGFKLPPLTITVCAECGKMRSVLFLSKDRWYCTGCRKSGDARPTQIALRRPRPA